MCENMKWAHLPVAGGLYDQHPELLEGFRYIFAKRAEFQEQEEAKREAKRKAEERRGSRGR